MQKTMNIYSIASLKIECCRDLHWIIVRVLGAGEEGGGSPPGNGVNSQFHPQRQILFLSWRFIALPLDNTGTITASDGPTSPESHQETGDKLMQALNGRNNHKWWSGAGVKWNWAKGARSQVLLPVSMSCASSNFIFRQLFTIILNQGFRI